MRLKRLFTLSLITASLLTITACGRKEVAPLEVPTYTPAPVAETVTPAEPIVVSVEPLNKIETAESELFIPDSDLDYYGKEVAKQRTTTSTPSAVPQDELTDEAKALFNPSGEHRSISLHGGSKNIFN